MWTLLLRPFLFYYMPKSPSLFTSWGNRTGGNLKWPEPRNRAEGCQQAKHTKPCLSWPTSHLMEGPLTALDSPAKGTFISVCMVPHCADLTRLDNFLSLSGIVSGQGTKWLGVLCPVTQDGYNRVTLFRGGSVIEQSWKKKRFPPFTRL